MTDPRLAFEDPRRVLKRHGRWAKRSFSQNFLIARSVVERIAARCHELDTGLVVELGPGLGTLTKALLATGSRVLAVERDRDMVNVLRTELSDMPRFDLLEGDAANLTFADLAATHATPLTVVGNLPYAITGAIFRNVVEAADVVPAAVFMVQREVRDRLQAREDTEHYGALTVFTTARYDVSTLMHVGRNCFHPAPNVDSSVVVLSRQTPPRATVSPTFQRLVKASFGQRRKTLRNAMLHSMDTEPSAVDLALSTAGIDGKRRGETLSVEEFASLAQQMQTIVD